LKSACKDEVIQKLYNECQKIKKGGKIEIYLQDVDFPIDIKYKTNFLNELKRKRIIKNYELKIERENLPPEIIDEISDLELGILPFISLEELESAPKDYKTVDRFEMDYMAFIECDPQKTKKRLEEDFKRIAERKEAEKRDLIKDQKDIASNFFINRNSNGDFYCRGKLIHFTNKDTIYYKVFVAVFEQNDPNGFCSYIEIDKFLIQDGENESLDTEKTTKRITNAVQNLFRFTKNLPQKAPDGRPIIDIKRGKGIVFYNPPI
jgi:hypothetical protein